MNAENDDVSSKIRRLCNRRQAGKKINNERGGNRKLEEDMVDKFCDYLLEFIEPMWELDSIHFSDIFENVNRENHDYALLLAYLTAALEFAGYNDPPVDEFDKGLFFKRIQDLFVNEKEFREIGSYISAGLSFLGKNSTEMLEQHKAKILEMTHKEYENGLDDIRDTGFGLNFLYALAEFETALPRRFKELPHSRFYLGARNIGGIIYGQCEDWWTSWAKMVPGR